MDDVDPRTLAGVRATPGLVVVHAGGAARCDALEVPAEGLSIGRELLERLAIDDANVSRAHAVVRRSRGLGVEDLGSRNGTFVAGVRVQGGEALPAGVPLRVGQTLFLAVDDVEAFRRSPTRAEGDRVVGPTLAACLNQLAIVAPRTRHLLVIGESGAGKELIARAFHELGSRPQGPFVAVNCATIPEALAERLLFGTRKGAYSGADAAAVGYFEAADGGTLFLDEIAELDAAVQAKLLRVLETGEVIPLGSTQPITVDVRLCTATFRDLRGAVQEGRFRHDLFFRINHGQVRLPSLSERKEEIPWHVQRALTAVDGALQVHATFVEACLLRPWPGNVRELSSAVANAAMGCLAAGRSELTSHDLDVEAGAESVPSHEGTPRVLPDDAEVERALAEHAGNVSAAARALGVHRNQLRRWLARR